MSDPLQDRQVRRRLAVLRHAEEVTGNVSLTCRYYGISRQCYYTWLRRFETEGPDGLRDRSHRPHHSPNATSDEVVEKIVHLRRHYHFGPAKIVMYLARYHDVTISVSGVWRILHRLDLGRLPASQRYQRHDQRWKRYEKARPGQRVQIDVKFIEALPPARDDASDSTTSAATPGSSSPAHIVETTGLAARRRRRYYQFTAIDDCTRLRVLKIYPRSNQKTAVEFLDHVLARLPFKVEVVQTDNGAEFQSSFHWHALDQGLQHVYIKPRTPRLNGKVERSHRIDAEEFYRLLDGVVIDDSRGFDDKLREWEDYYNYHRPHGGLGGQTPYERLRQKTAGPAQT